MGWVPQYSSWYCPRCQRYVPAAAQPWPPQQYQQPQAYGSGYGYQQPMGGGPWPQAYAPPDASVTKSALVALTRHQPAAESAVAPGQAYGFLAAQAVFLAALYVSFTLILIDGETIDFADSMPLVLAVLALWVILGIVQAVIVHRLVAARDAHFRRDRALRETMLQHLSALNSADNGSMGMEIATLAHINSSARVEDNRDRGALLWAVMAFVPVVNMLTVPVILYGLTRDLAAHDMRQAFFCHYAGLALARTGKGIRDPAWQPMAERSAGLYMLLAFVTGGLFLFYWYYVALGSMSAHLASQRRFEESLAALLQG